MYIPYFSMGALEINSQRTAAYLANVCAPGDFKGNHDMSCDCGPLHWVIDDESGEPEPVVYTTPTADAAAWYDADIPESGEFLGFIVNEVVMNSVSSRSITTRSSSSGGGVLGPVRNKERRFDFTVLMFACNEIAMEYGFRFLTNALTSNGCEGGCVLPDAEYRDSCPAVDGSLTSLNRGRWILKNVGSVEGPNWDKPPVAGMACNVRMVKFSLVSEMPWKFKSPVTVCEDLALAGSPAWDGDCENVSDVLCEQQYVYCSVTEPLVIGESGLIIKVTAGSVPLEHITISIIPDQFGYEAAPETAPMDYVPVTPSDQIVIPWLPADSTLIYDTAVESVTVMLADTSIVDGSPYISTAEGTPPTFPALRCGAFAIRVGVSECSVVGDPTVTIESVHREA